VNIEQLEDRNQLTPIFTNNGVLQTPTGALRPFDDWHGELPIAANSMNMVAVSAGEGGGSRVALLNLDTLERVQGDFFAFEPEFRGGVEVALTDTHLFVSPKVGGGPVLVTYKITQDGLVESSREFKGNPNSRNGLRIANPLIPEIPIPEIQFHGTWVDPQIPPNIPSAVIYLDFETSRPEFNEQVFQTVTQILDQVDLFTITTHMPLLRQDEYLRLDIVDNDNLYLGLTPDTRGFALGGILSNIYTRFQPRTSYAKIQFSPISTGITVAHEIGHWYNLHHNPDENNLMFGGGTTLNSLTLTNEQITQLHNAHMNPAPNIFATHVFIPRGEYGL
jgi:hypothetical protein